jgi:hypothetical protein
MPDHDGAGLPVQRGNSEREASPGVSRRSVLWGAAGAGVAGIAATALVGSATLPAMAAPRGGAHADAADTAADTADQIVVHVRDARSGEIDVFRGTSHTRLHDPALAARLLRASR